MQPPSSVLISIVDDDPSVSEATARLLRANGFTATIFLSAADFLQSPDLVRTALLILDVCMPGLSGVKLSRHLVAEQRRIPTLFITAHGSAEDRAAALAEGAIGYLNKPFTEDALLLFVRQVIPQPESCGP